MTNAMTAEKISISGARMAMRIIIIYAICTFVTSVVRRVTSDEDENLSMFWNEKNWMLRNRSCRTFFAKPAEAREQVKPATPPHVSDATASTISSSPEDRISFVSAPDLIRLTRSAVMNGMNVSMIASPMMNTSVRIVGVLNSRTHLESRLSMDTLPFPNGMVQSYNITNKV